MGLKSFFESLKSRNTVLPNLIEINDQHVVKTKSGEESEEQLGKINPEKDYFVVRVNEMFLDKERKWFSEIEPMVVCLTTYIYGNEEIDNPFIVGRSLLQAKLKEIPQGMVFRDTRVAGIHPFSGGRLILGIVLCKTEVENHLTDSIEFIESISGVLNQNLKSLVGNYLPIANVVVSGIDKLFNAKGVTPLFGFRREYDADIGEGVNAGYFAMIDKSPVALDPGNFFVKDDRLFFGDVMESAVEFYKTEKGKGLSYVLFSIKRSDTRSDVKTLPVFKQYNRILNEIKAVAEVSQEHKDRIKSMLRVLSIEMRQSPDLTEPQAEKLMVEYIERIQGLIEPKFNFGASSKQPEDKWSILDKTITSI